VRPIFFELAPVTAEAASRPRLLVLGGSQGAQQLNREMPAAVAAIRRSGSGLSVLHQCGAAHVEATRAAYAHAGLAEDKAIEVTPFLDDIACAMAEAHLIVTRAGAITAAEICAAGRAALFVPLSIAGGHQIDNARALADAGAARLVMPAEATAERLTTELRELLADPSALAAMGAAARTLAKPDAVRAIADEVERLAGIAPRAAASGGAR
jgi:UDP-N-acetylglucosamine--N-acetylmuramyl-(pentapeptide) pyrophosphoryl-undecaprenol N-acetylglucosamine transferase